MKLTEIAAEMFITVDTVKTHVKAIQAKTGLTHLVRVEMLRRVFVSVDGDGITKERMIVAAARALGCENDRNMEYILKDINLFLKE
jgi:predicted transcriptional regulator